MRLDAVTLKQMRAFLSVVETGSLTLAADLLHQTPPTIHSQIKNLELAAGTALLIRPQDGTGFRPTAAGEEMIAAAQRIEANLSQAARQIEAVSQGKSGHVVLGTMSTAKYFVPRLVRMLQDRIPEVEITLKVTNRSDAIAAMARGEYDLTIMGRPPRNAVRRAVPLGPHPHGIVLPPDHPLAGKDGYDPMQLLRETFLSREDGSGTRTLMERFFERLAEGHAPKTVVMPSNETIKQAVLAGLGIAFLSLHTVHDEVQAGRLVLLRGPGLPVMRHWYLIRGSDGPGPMTRAAERCGEEIEALGGIYLPRLIG
ncbi:LysR family transcriptional regulator [Paracoccus subflavus]|uniref:HTH-type transcriptional regulator CbbR n=1 Tax=Paracoccus subflavus TaxID=2528244 RepID=A0A4Q9FW20_9RHOB|nr:LysR family transcriptional regulator [Paracoccus subflavus]TBN37526.1 LysR family transcriptional regulator [Paracoccus subflavus]